MTKYLIVYHSPMNPSVEAAPADMDMEAEMKAWMDWGAGVGKNLTDFGTPLAGGVHVAPGGGTSPSTLEVSGYSFVEADSMDAAVGYTKNHPHLNFPGASIEVHELQAVPGM